MGNIPCDGKFGVITGAETSARARANVFRECVLNIAIDIAAAGNHGVIRPRAFPAIDASWPLVTLSSRACFPYTYIVALPIPRLLAGENSISQFFRAKEAQRFGPGI